MNESRSPLWNIKPAIRLDRRNPYLLLQHITLFVRDQEKSLRFFVDYLGFDVVLDYSSEDLSRWVMVAPPDGTARLALVAPRPDSEEYPYIGKGRQIVFLTENVEAMYREWGGRGVRFLHPPTLAPWGSVVTRFEDIDGNRFALIEFDEATRQVEQHRRHTEERLEFERRAAWEAEIARQVQARLLPQRMPAVCTLDYAGACLQARHVGGDYYDFLDLGQGRLGLVIADIAGKGMAAALLMANLQANLRSQCATAADQPQQFLRSVNQLFYENTAEQDYATFFFCEYNDTTQRLRYVNGGHLSPLLLRCNATLERLAPTATVLGLFEQWDCALEERQLSPGDTLLLYTDGATEALNDAQEQFGEERLAEVFERHRGLAAQRLLASLVEEVRKFNPGEQHDDITLVVATCRGTGSASGS